MKWKKYIYGKRGEEQKYIRLSFGLHNAIVLGA